MMRALHVTPDLATFTAGLLVATATLTTPLWHSFFQWNAAAHRMPGGANERWSLAHAVQGDTSTNCGIERWHRHLKERSVNRVHLNLRDCATFLLGELENVENLMRSTNESSDLPLYFGAREETRDAEKSAALKASTEYLHALQRAGAAGDSFRFLRTQVAGSNTQIVDIVTAFQHGAMVATRNVSWSSFIRTQSIHHATCKACTCIKIITTKL